MDSNSQKLGIIGGAPPPGITPPGDVPGDDGDDGEDDGSNSVQTQTPQSTVFSSSSPASSSASSTGVVVTAIGDVNYDGWQAINQVPIQPVGPTPDGDDFGSATTTSLPAAQTVTVSGAICVLPPGSNDPACHPISTIPPTPTSTTPPSPTSTIAVAPTGNDVNCLTSQPAGARMMDCFGMLGRFNTDQRVCTSDPGACISGGDSYCKASGGKCDPNGSDFVDTSNYCMLAQSSGCAFVIANKQSSFGFPGSSCVTGAQIDQYIRGAANGCAGDGTIALQVGPDVSNGVRQDTYCLISQDQPGVCGA